MLFQLVNKNVDIEELLEEMDSDSEEDGSEGRIREPESTESEMENNDDEEFDVDL